MDKTMCDRRYMKQVCDRSSIIAFLVGILIICLMGNISSLANRTIRGRSDNVITSDEVKVSILNLQADWTEMPDTIYNIIPGTHVDNFVYARNVCKQDEWVRIKVTPEILDENGDSLPVDDVTFSFNTAEWVEKDGYWYYTSPLKAGDVSTCLYSSINFGTNIDNRYKTATLTVNLDLTAVQYVNNTDNVLDAAGWEDN